RCMKCATKSDLRCSRMRFCGAFRSAPHRRYGSASPAIPNLISGCRGVLRTPCHEQKHIGGIVAITLVTLGRHVTTNVSTASGDVRQHPTPSVTRPAPYSPYSEAVACIASHLLPDQRQGGTE